MFSRWEISGVGLAIALSVLLGCGGGGGAAPLPQVPLTVANRQLQVGDSCTYSFSGTSTPPGGAPFAISGTAVHTVTERKGNLVTIMHDLTFDGTPLRVHQIGVEVENPDGTTVPVSDNSGPNQTIRTVTSTTVKGPGVWKSPLFLTGTTLYSDGSKENSTLSVSGTTKVQTGIAIFDTWVARGTLKSSYGNTVETTSYVVPGLGFAVGKTEVSTQPLAGTARVKFALVSTTVPLPN
jgi:hypothetical protein